LRKKEERLGREKDKRWKNNNKWVSGIYTGGQGESFFFFSFFAFFGNVSSVVGADWPEGPSFLRTVWEPSRKGGVPEIQLAKNVDAPFPLFLSHCSFLGNAQKMATLPKNRLPKGTRAHVPRGTRGSLTRSPHLPPIPSPETPLEGSPPVPMKKCQKKKKKISFFFFI
jgi:hypothetical protein